MKPKVLALRELYPSCKKLLETHCEVEYLVSNDREHIKSALRDKDGMICSQNISIDEDLIQEATRLKVVSNMSVGYNNMKVADMTKRKIWGTHTPYVLDDTTADTILSLMLATARRTSELDAYVRAGQWKPDDYENLYGIDVHHTRAGIIGMGRIGEVVAKRCVRGFDMQVLYYNRNRKANIESELGVQYASVDEICETCDFIIVMTPLTSETRNLISHAQFVQMKPTAILINAARGPVVNQEALLDALQQQKIYGVGLDVYNEEPISDNHPLLQFRQVVALPHIGSATHRTREAMAKMAVENCISGVKGIRPPNVVPEQK